MSGSISEILKRIANGTFYHWSVWRKLRSDVIKRDNYECRNCKKPIQKVRLYAHHIKELKKFPHLALDINNIITLCGNCHNEIHDKEEQMNQYKNKKEKFINEERW